MDLEVYKRFMNIYRNLLEEAPGVKKALDNILKTLEESEKKNKIMGKALENHLEKLLVLPILLRANEADQAKEITLRKTVKTVETLKSIQNLIFLDGIPKEQLKRNSEYINLEEIARNHIRKNFDYIKEEQLGLYFRYNKSPNDKPLEIFTNKSVINAIWEVILNNSMVWAPHFSTITQAFRIDKRDNLEIIIQNTYSKEKPREPNGVVEEGIPIIKNLIEKINGNFELYRTKSEIKNNYNFSEEFGSKIAIRKRKEHAEKYGAIVTIPMDELTPYEKEI